MLKLTLKASDVFFALSWNDNAKTGFVIFVNYQYVGFCLFLHR